MVSASAQSPDYTQQLITLQNELNLINNHIGNLGVLTESNFDYNMDWLFDIMLGPVDSQTGNRPSVTNTKNILALLQSINSAVRQSGDILAGNPWWSTNSAFAFTRGQYNSVYPNEFPNGTYTYSFPQFISKWSGLLSYPYTGNTMPDFAHWFDWFGRYNPSTGRPITFNSDNPYTWFNWVSDMMRSNAIVRAHLAAYTSESEAEQSLTSLDSSTAEEFATNAPPQVDEFQIEMPPGLTGFQTVSDAFEDFIDDLTPSLTGGDSEITVLPALSVGGISTTAYKFDFNNSIVPYCRAVMSFLWAVMCGAMMFRLLSGEWAYYCSLGRTSH